MKFRFWNKEENEMMYQDDQYLSSFLRRIYNRYSVTHPSYLPFQIEDRLTQSTGLKDKNGKLIYEGDKLKSNSKYHSFVVKFGKYNTNGYSSADSENFGFYLHNVAEGLEEDFHLRDLDGICCYYPRHCADKEEYALENFGVEIIGNIYENKIEQEK